MGQGLRVEGICLGQLSGGFGKVTGLAGIDHRHRQSGGGQRRHHGPLVAPRGFEDNQGGRHGLEAFHQGSNPDVIIGHGPTFATGPQGNIELGFGDIDTNKIRRGKHHDSYLARPCQIRACMAPGNGSGSRRSGRDDPSSAPVSVDQG
jgi:hypothetical protein